MHKMAHPSLGKDARSYGASMFGALALALTLGLVWLAPAAAHPDAHPASPDSKAATKASAKNEASVTPDPESLPHEHGDGAPHDHGTPTAPLGDKEMAPPTAMPEGMTEAHSHGEGAPPHDHGEGAMMSGHDEAMPHGHDEAAPHDHGGSAATGAASEHDHSAHSGSEAMLQTGFGRFLVWLGKFHPAAVHLPIGLLLGAALAELLALKYNPSFFQAAGRFCLWTGAIAALGAVALGWLYGGFSIVDKETVLTAHRWNGTGVALLALLALWLGEKRVRAPQAGGSGLYRSVLFTTALLVGLNGYLGGLMVYGAKQHAWPMAHAHE
ncbi:MAG: DUF2231 domain-containing protein [Pseudomonadota bacterium]